MECKSDYILLQAYADGELDAIRMVEVEAHLRDCPACQQVVENLNASRSALREGLPRYAASANLTKNIRAALPAAAPAHRARTVNFRPRAGWVSALAATLVLGFFIGLQHGQSNSLLDEALASHTRSLMASHLMDVASTDQHTVKPWFEGKINFAPPVVDLAAAGFPLVGGRLDELNHQTVAALVYGRNKHFINLFVWPSASGAVPGGQTEASGYQINSWTQGGLNFIAVSEIPAADLAAFAQAYRDQTHP
ncbi:MAG TPA: anti-sigma factor [Opitutales bacterium]|nr:anti-sigma factor [Opitutales bacterium]